MQLIGEFHPPLASLVTAAADGVLVAMWMAHQVFSVKVTVFLEGDTGSGN